MEAFVVTYRIRLRKRVVESFDFVFDARSGDLQSELPTHLPRWTELDYQQCPHCPLQKTQHPHCPLAVQLFRIIDRLHTTTSFDEVDLEVVTPERTITQRVELQRVIGSMVGLVSPTCGCPKTAYMKPMARFHLPLSTEEETLFRVTGMYLLAQHILGQTKMDLAGLNDIYEQLHVVNKHIASRLKHATESDSSKNAIALLDMYSNLVPMMIEEQLPELRRLFSAYEINTATVPLPPLQPVSPQPVVVTPPVTLTLQEIAPVPSVPSPAAAAAPTLKIKTKTPEDIALENLIQDVPVDELESLLGATTLSLEPIKDGKSDQEQPKSFGRAVFKLPDD